MWSFKWLVTVGLLMMGAQALAGVATPTNDYQPKKQIEDQKASNWKDKDWNDSKNWPNGKGDWKKDEKRKEKKSEGNQKDWKDKDWNDPKNWPDGKGDLKKDGKGKEKKSEGNQKDWKDKDWNDPKNWPNGKGDWKKDGNGGFGGGGMSQILKTLDLTQEQKAKLKDLRKARRDRSQALGNKLEDAREALEDLLEVADKSKAYEDKLRAKNDEVDKLQQECQRDQFESLLEIRSVLTDAQLKKFVEMYNQTMDDKEKMRGRGGESWKGMWSGKGWKGKWGWKASQKDDDQDDKPGDKDKD